MKQLETSCRSERSFSCRKPTSTSRSTALSTCPPSRRCRPTLSAARATVRRLSWLRSWPCTHHRRRTRSLARIAWSLPPRSMMRSITILAAYLPVDPFDGTITACLIGVPHKRSPRQSRMKELGTEPVQGGRSTVHTELLAVHAGKSMDMLSKSLFPFENSESQIRRPNA